MLVLIQSPKTVEQLDPGLSKRPSRFDRKYLFPFPSEDERILYCNYWRNKLRNRDSIPFPKILCPAIAQITEDFSFAYLKEAFVATLLAIANDRSDGDEDNSTGGSEDDENEDDDDDDDDGLDRFELWREMKKQVKILRDDMDAGAGESEVRMPHAFSSSDPKHKGKMELDADVAVSLSPLDALKRVTVGEQDKQILPQQVESKLCEWIGSEYYPDEMLKKMEL